MVFTLVKGPGDPPPEQATLKMAGDAESNGLGWPRRREAGHEHPWKQNLSVQGLGFDRYVTVGNIPSSREPAESKTAWQCGVLQQTSVGSYRKHKAIAVRPGMHR